VSGLAPDTVRRLVREALDGDLHAQARLRKHMDLPEPEGAETEFQDGHPVPTAVPYLTVIHSRTPVVKLHESLGRAKSAFYVDDRKVGTLWTYIDGRWKLLYDVKGHRIDDGSRYGGFARRLPWKDAA
jgi:hypothetical protein